jgi:choline dehydrogenase-like flavoprotein
MKTISLTEAQESTWDVVIVGTSHAAMFFARHLPRSLADRSRILFIEKGPYRAHSTQLVERSVGTVERFAQQDKSGRDKTWIAHSIFGGNSNRWWACTPRLHPEDFELGSRYGIGTDWPIGYAELEPFYCAVEEGMDVSGGGSDAYLPRSRPFPAPPHAPSLTDMRLRERADWFAQPTARSTGTRRAKCCANGVCHLCPVDSKFTILNSFDLFDRPNHSYLLGVEARAVSIANGVARSVSVRAAGGASSEIRGDLIALGANAIFNAAILLRSGVDNPHLGANLDEQASREVRVSIDQPNYLGGTSISGHGYGLYPGDHRRELAAVLVENWNAPAALRMEPGKWTHCMRLKLIAEDLPQARNRVRLVDDEPVIDWHGHHAYAYAGLERAVGKLGDILPFAVSAIEPKDFARTEGHIQGTTRMGRSAAEGVIDADLKCFAATNLLCLGAGAFPSCSPANPTLTLAALSARAAARL